jgi:hypothetical protein
MRRLRWALYRGVSHLPMATALALFVGMFPTAREVAQEGLPLWLGVLMLFLIAPVVGFAFSFVTGLLSYDQNNSRHSGSGTPNL